MPFPIDDLPAAIRTTKAVLRAAMPNRAPVFRALEGDIARQADAILTDRAQGRDTIPCCASRTSPPIASIRRRSPH